MCISRTVPSVTIAVALLVILWIAWPAAPVGADAAGSKSLVVLPDPPKLIPDAARRAKECLECHDEMVDLLVGDKHIGDDFHCVVCHGTSQAHLDMEKEGTLPDRVWRRWVEEENRYKWRVEMASLEIARFCASCHGRKPAISDAIKTINWRQYLDSPHGMAVREGNPDGPTCTDCHYAHGAGAEPLKGRNVVRRCAVCHGDREMMKRLGLDGNVMDDFDAGTHADMEHATDEEKSSCVPCHDPH